MIKHPKKEKLRMLLTLLQEESYKIQTLAHYLGVSITTLTAYLDELSDWLKPFNVRITRKRGVGVELIGTEADKRKALARYILQHFNEELIEILFLLRNGKYSQRKCFGLF